MPNQSTATHPQSLSPSPDRKNRHKASRVASKKIARQAHLVESERARSPFQEQEDFSDEDLPPSLSEVLDMPKFERLEIVASDESLQEVLQEGDW